MPGISSIALLTARGHILLYRAYRDDVDRSFLERFRSRLRARGRDEKTLTPIVSVDGVTFAWVRRKDLWAVVTTVTNFNPMLAVQYLNQLMDLLGSYLGAQFTEKDVRNNFVLVYELLDETLDFGVPQNCSPEVLQLYVFDSATKAKELAGSKQAQTQLTDQITGKADWRKADIKYPLNEIYIDLLESVNVLVAADGAVLRSDVQGEVKVRCFLSGMPECKLMINDKLMLDQERKDFSQTLPSSDAEGSKNTRGGRPKHQKPTSVEIEDLSFHRCVRLGKFDADRSVVFVPPDGVFELLKYRVAENVDLPFRVLVVMDQTKTKCSFNVRVTPNFSPKVTAQNVIVKIPCPPNTTKVEVFASHGKAKWEPTEQGVMWKIRSIPGGTEMTLNCTIDLAPLSHDKPWSKPPVTMNFKVNTFTSSGIYVRNIRVVEASGYVPNKYVRYLTRAGSYQIRI